MNKSRTFNSLGLNYFQTSGNNKQPIIGARASLALDIFCELCNGGNFSHQTIGNTQTLKKILESCVDTADYLISLADTKNETE